MVKVFPYAVAVMEFGAAVVYAYKGQWALAGAWLFYSAACVCLAEAGQ